MSFDDWYVGFTCKFKLIQILGMFDRDGDSSINFNEFQALWRYVEDWTKCFRSFDRDNSGNFYT